MLSLKARDMLGWIDVRRTDPQQVHSERMWIASIRSTISDTHAAVPSTNAGFACLTVRWRWWRVPEFGTLWHKGEVDIFDFLCTRRHGTGEQKE